MPLFEYKARGPRGDAIEGRVEANTVDAVAGRLIEGGLVPIEIQPAQVKSHWNRDLNDIFPEKVKLADLIQFSRQMHSLLRAGVPILSALNGLTGTTRNRTLAKALAGISDMLEAGHDLASALARHEAIFSSFYISLVRVGETTGQLEEIFLQLAYYLEREKKTRDQIKSALRYPIFVISAIAIALAIINVFVIPAFSDVFARYDAELPMMTRFLIGMSDFFVNQWPVLLALLIGSFFGLRMYLNSESGRYRWDRFKLRLPLVGTVLEKATLSRYARLFSLAHKAGVPLMTTLTVISKAVDNSYFEDRVLAMRTGIERGDSITNTAMASGLFDPLVLQMMAVGEQSGTLDELLGEVARYYDQEVEYSIERLAGSIEPILTVVIGIMVLVLALGIFLPMWGMAGAILGKPTPGT
ncbi:MSHA biogenesis protein MshG [Thiohalobacter sp. COW1]|uniref:type II secretion system F family protein n=1 Tax=Thiohalobacter sp. COW1 TaxID=2795687 RepID=UPI0019159571|nr:type II secretion system F family protein [Thiohalobacter sp. COW1]BCO32447.1 MSHA biogenesis protein MshG [Thiohalobacter sp. COW1]